MAKSRPFPWFSLSSFHVIFHVICFFINENVAENNWLQKFKNFSELCYKENSPQIIFGICTEN